MSDENADNGSSATLISLSKVRKSKAKDDKKKQAAENRVRFGRSGARKKSDKLAKLRTESELDGKKRDD